MFYLVRFRHGGWGVANLSPKIELWQTDARICAGHHSIRRCKSWLSHRQLMRWRGWDVTVYGGMNMKGVAKYLILLCYVAAFAYGGYGWYSYSGLYRLAAEWQIETFGSYSLKLTLAIALFAPVLPVAAASKYFGWPSPAGASLAPRNLKASPRVILTLAFVLIVVAAGAGWYGYGKANETIAFESIDLSNSQPAKATHAIITGVAHTEYQMEFQTKSGGMTTINRYIPLTAVRWRRGDPLVYFMKTNATAYVPPGGGRIFEFSTKTPPFPITTEPGAMVENGLPGPVAEVYRKHNISVASSAIVLDVINTRADVDIYFVVAGVSGIFGLSCLLAGAVTAVRQRRLREHKTDEQATAA
jgi:hypothetical protein